MPSRKTSQAAAEAASVEAARAALGTPEAPQPKGPGGTDPLIGDLRRAGLLPLLVLHFVSEAPSYGNQLIEQIENLTGGSIVLNPNTMYPLLRELETRGLVEGAWEHPEKRSRRLYELTWEGRQEYDRLREGLEPFLDSIVDSITLIKQAVYGPGEGGGEAAPRRSR